MNNYEYITACLPELEYAGERKSLPDTDALTAEIRSLCDEHDAALVDFLLSGFKEGNMDSKFYVKALSHRNRFIREWFAYDLDVRNAKAEYVNAAIGRDPETDTIMPERREEKGFDDLEKVNAILSGSDPLGREQALDELMWEKIDELTRFSVFDMDAILGAVAKLTIAGRWLKLDEQTGRNLFRRMVDGLRKAYDNKKNSI